jgi:hypothetical protein
MPIHLPLFIGGLGNQMFSITAIISLADKYNTTCSFNKEQSVSNGISNSRVYYDIFNYLHNESIYNELNTLIPQTSLSINQFEDIIIDTSIVESHTILLNGLPMKYSIISQSINKLKDVFNSIKMKYIDTTTRSTIPKLAIGMRTFAEEGRESEWSTSLEYYRKAIEYMSTKVDICTIDIYTDKVGSSDKLIPILREYFKDRCTSINEYAGNRNANTDVNHFFQMFEYDHYILCNSTYHYWPALLSVYNNTTKIVTWPSDSECNWYLHLAAPEWVNL